jgi:DUF4097 and DUF4098 domain-containing protein YvlB
MRRHLLALMLLLPAFAWAATQSGTEFHWKGRVAPEKTVTIKALNGSIEVTGSDGDEVEVTATKSGAHADQMQVQVIPSADGILVCETYRYEGDYSDTCGDGSGGSHGHSRGQAPHVDYEVRIPRNLQLHASSVNGSVEAERIGRQAEVSSVNGGVRVSTSAWAKASSVNGSVSCTFGKADWDHLKLSSVNGSIHVTLPADANTDVRFRSVNGDFESDFPVTVQGRMGRHSMEGKIGSGGRELELSTVNGSVTLQKSTM